MRIRPFLKQPEDNSISVEHNLGRYALDRSCDGALRREEQDLLPGDRRCLWAKGGKMFDRILFPTDFSDVAEKALDAVKRLKDVGTREVIVLHVIKKQSIEVLAQYSSIRDFPEVEREVEGDARRALSRIEKELKALGFEVTIRIETGFPSSEILRVEAEEAVSAIVIGSHGLSNIKEILLGSVSESVIRKAEKPVLVIKR